MAAVREREGAERDTVAIVRDLLDETQELFRQHLELAKMELLEAVESRVRGAAAFVVAGVCGLFALGFLAAALAWGFMLVMPAWLARVLVAIIFLVVAGASAVYGLQRLRRPPMKPESTVQALREDREWARSQLRS